MSYYHLLSAIVLSLAAASAFAADAAKDSRCYELRIYTAAEGKLDALHARFRDHTCKLFEKHGITNIGYWVPLENPEHKLYYIIAYPDRASHDKMWNAFLADPDWKAAKEASEKDGKLVVNVESKFMHATDFSPEIKPVAEKEPRVFELRTYTATPGNLARLHARFRDHTMTLFDKHGMTSFAYWALDADQKKAEDTLVYMLAHKSKADRDASFKAFGDDPAWKAVKAASEKDAGPLTIKDGVKSLLLTPTDYSPTK